MARAARSEDAGLLFLNSPGRLFLNEDAVDTMRQLTGLGGQGTVDELGFGPLHDRLAEKLFPWCSTLTTRARYFFFSYAVQHLAASEVVGRDRSGAELDAAEAKKAAVRHFGAYRARVGRLERAVALSLAIKHEAAGVGIFGVNRCRRWLNEGDTRLRDRGNILSSEQRYPNAIYRGACRALDMFRFDRGGVGLLTVKLMRKPDFSASWQQAGRRCRAEVEALGSFWDRMHTESRSFAQARSELLEQSFFEKFRGFLLSPREEAGFLYDRLCAISPYLQDVAAPDVARLLRENGDDIDLLAVARKINDPFYRNLFMAAHHVDLVTAPFRDLYAALVEDFSAGAVLRLDTRAIRASYDWLQRHSSADGAAVWAPGWFELTPRIADWLARASRRARDDLPNALLARAEEVVAGRGMGKVAPHKRSQAQRRGDNDLRRELHLSETSFRRGNAARILQDVADGVAS